MSSPTDPRSIPRTQALRRIFMRSLLSFQPLIVPICCLACEVLPTEERLTTATDRMRRVIRELRSMEFDLDPRAFERAREDLACALDEVDAHDLLADLIVADLIGIEAGQEAGLSLKLEPLSRTVSFLRYVVIVRRNHQAVWTARAFTA